MMLVAGCIAIAVLELFVAGVELRAGSFELKFIYNDRGCILLLVAYGYQPFSLQRHLR